MTDRDKEKLKYVIQTVREHIGDMVRADTFELFYTRAGEVKGYLLALAIERVVTDDALLNSLRAEFDAAKEKKLKLLNEGMASEPKDGVWNVTEEDFDQAARRLLGVLHEKYVAQGYSRSNICDAIARKALTGTLFKDDPEALAVVKEAAYGFWVGARPTDDDINYDCEIHGD